MTALRCSSTELGPARSLVTLNAHAPAHAGTGTGVASQMNPGTVTVSGSAARDASGTLGTMSRHVTTTLRTERLRDTSQHGTHPPRPRLVRSGGHGHRVLTSPNANSCGEGGLAWRFDRCTRARRRWGRHRARQGTVDRGPEGKVLRVVANQDPIRPRCRTCGSGLRRRPSRWILRGRKCPMGAMLEWLGRQGLPHRRHCHNYELSVADRQIGSGRFGACRATRGTESTAATVLD